ncbi:MAG: hypothetical protein RIC35_18920 [Marinoscillum sp.]
MRRLIIATLLLSSSYCYCQKGIAELAQEDYREYAKNIFIESKYNDFQKPLKKGYITPEDLQIKRVGLLTFSLFEQDYKKDKALITYEYVKAGKSLIERIYDTSLPGIADSVRSYGITLITPNEFDSDQKLFYKAALDEIKLIFRKKLDLYDRLAEMDLSNTPTGIGFAPVFLEDGNNEDINVILGRLCEQLQLDALLSIQLTSNHFNYSIAFTNALMMINIPSPSPGSKVYGQKLASYFYLTQAPVGFVGLDKGVVSGEDLSGFPTLLGRMVGDFFNMITIEQEMLVTN